MASARSPWLPEHVAGVPDRWVAPLARLLGDLLGVSAMERLAASVAAQGSLSGCAQALLEALHIRVEWRGESLADQVSAQGPLVVIGNHPFGLLDGLLSMAVLPPLRPDVKFLGQQVWQHMPAIDAALVPLKPTTGHRVAGHNARSLRTAIRWVRNGHAVALFPAPRVATWSWASCRVADPPWSDLVGVLAARAGAELLPVHVAGSNSLLFQAAAAVVDPLHHALLIREFLNKRHRTIIVTVGRRVAPQSLGCGADPRRITRRLHQLVEGLGRED